MRFYCDEMLKRLGRWLRAAGYDTLIAENGIPDRELMHTARNEHRYLVTRDRKLLEHRGADKTVVLLASNTVEDCARELAGRVPVDWLYRPFSRCLQCNTPLVPTADRRRSHAPPNALTHDEPTWYCPHCAQVFWAGSHVRRMAHKLARWQKQKPANKA